MPTRITDGLANFFIYGPAEYLQKVMANVRLIWGILIAGVEFVLFPDDALRVSLLSVLGAAMLDIITRFLAMKKLGDKSWNSEKFWEGTGIKLVAYLVIAFLAGLSYRLTPLLERPSIYLWTVAYVVMFLREVQSNLENLSDMGADVGWLNSWAKRKERQILGKDDDDDA